MILNTFLKISYKVQSKSKHQTEIPQDSLSCYVKKQYHEPNINNSFTNFQHFGLIVHFVMSKHLYVKTFVTKSKSVKLQNISISFVFKREGAQSVPYSCFPNASKLKVGLGCLLALFVFCKIIIGITLIQI